MPCFDPHAEYRVSGKKLKEAVERWDEAGRRVLDRYIYKLTHEIEMDLIDARRDW